MNSKFWRLSFVGLRWLTFAFGVWLSAPGTCSASVEKLYIDELFGDGAVIQHSANNMIAGGGRPFASLRISANGRDVGAAGVDAGGRWKFTLPKFAAGRDLKIEVADSAGGDGIVVHYNVGELWLCFGQSNILMSVRDNGGVQLAAKDFELPVSEFSVMPVASTLPMDKVLPRMGWRHASSANVGGFSAACYHFAANRAKSIHLPVGIVLSGVGATSISAWRPSHETAGGEPGASFEDIGRVDIGRDLSPRYCDVADSWFRSLPQVRAPEMAVWSKLPSAPRSGAYWYRLKFNLPRTPASDVRLKLSGFKGSDVGFVNGACAWYGSQPSELGRSYVLPRNTVHVGINEINILIDSQYEPGGIYGIGKALIADTAGTEVGAGIETWNQPAVVDRLPMSPLNYSFGRSLAWNAMIYPLRALRLTGAIWYQGEGSNGGGSAYKDVLSEIVAELRRWNPAVAFLVVQLPRSPGASSQEATDRWAEVREAQLSVVRATPRAGLVVTVDMETHDELHPKGKELIGERLAAAASKLLQGTLSPNGLVPKVNRAGPDRLDVIFAESVGLAGARVIMPGVEVPGFEVCQTGRVSCVSARAHVLDGHSVTVDIAGIDGSALYYCWANVRRCALRVGNSAQSPFRFAY